MDNANNKFLDMAAKGLTINTFPHFDLGTVQREQEFRHLLVAVEALPADLLPGLENSDPSTYSYDQLEALRPIGRNIRDSVIRMRRDSGNTLFAQSKQQSDWQGQAALRQARKVWSEVMMNGGVEALTTQCNYAASSLDMQK